MDYAKLAEQIARKSHEGQTRWDKVTPYITHPEYIANVIRTSLYNSYGDCGIATAWLHDVIEDCNVTATQLLEQGIPDIVVLAVLALTKFSEYETYLHYILRVKDNDMACAVKVEDIKHNISTLGDKNKNRLDKYLLALHILKN